MHHKDFCVHSVFYKFLAGILQGSFSVVFMNVSRRDDAVLTSEL